MKTKYLVLGDVIIKLCNIIKTLTLNRNMKKVLLIALALITCFAAEAQLRSIKPAYIDKNLDDIQWIGNYHVDNIVASSTLN